MSLYYLLVFYMFHSLILSISLLLSLKGCTDVSPRINHVLSLIYLSLYITVRVFILLYILFQIMYSFFKV